MFLPCIVFQASRIQCRFSSEERFAHSSSCAWVGAAFAEGTTRVLERAAAWSSGTTRVLELAAAWASGAAWSSVVCTISRLIIHLSNE